MLLLRVENEQCTNSYNIYTYVIAVQYYHKPKELPHVSCTKLNQFHTLIGLVKLGSREVILIPRNCIMAKYFLRAQFCFARVALNSIMCTLALEQFACKTQYVFSKVLQTHVSIFITQCHVPILLEHLSWQNAVLRNVQLFLSKIAQGQLCRLNYAIDR